MAGEDFVMVQLSAAGVMFANGGPLRFSNGKTSFSFVAGTPQRVAKYEWRNMQVVHTRSGDAVFELAMSVPVHKAAPAPPPAPAGPISVASVPAAGIPLPKPSPAPAAPVAATAPAASTPAPAAAAPAKEN